ncbi:MAG: glutathione S-transferase family protein [Rhodospirillales bacterium]|nr:glutathione S-transferase family protein [Rhodospirillales bacterium]
MSGYRLILGNKSYSSWSLRAWLGLRQAGIDFEERVIPMYTEEWERDIKSESPTGKVPVLQHDGRFIWDTLAILEYAAERHPEAGLWPTDEEARALARSVSAEMHSGFMALRSNMPMILLKTFPGKGIGEGVAEDIARICQIWRDCRARFGGSGDLLFGSFTIADAMFAPVVSRFETYGVDLDDTCRAYAEAVRGLSAMRQWREEALAEPWVIDRYDPA